MAEFEDIKQNIILDYKTNALDSAKQVDVLSQSTENVVQVKKQNIAETKNEEATFKSFKQQIREATQEQLRLAQQYGLTSKESVEATKKLAMLRDEMKDAKSLTDGFNPDRKFQALGTAVTAAATAAQGVTAGMALFGGASEDTAKALLKVQAAMAFSDAIGRISEMGDDFRKLKAQAVSMYTSLTTAKVVDTTTTEVNTIATGKNIAVTEGSAVASGVAAGGFSLQTAATTAATIATNILNASLAVLLSPIVLIIAAIAAVVGGIAYFSGAVGDFSGEGAKAEKATKKMSKELDALAIANEKANDRMVEGREGTLALAKAHGKSSEELRKLEKTLIDHEVVQKRLNALKAQSIYLNAAFTASLENATDADKENAKKALENFKEQNKVYNDSQKERRKIAISHSVAIVQEETDKHNEILDKQKEANKKKKDDQEKADQKAIDDAKKLKEDLANLETKYLTDIQNLNDNTDQLKLDRQKQRDLDEIEVLRKKGKDVSNLLIYNAEKYAQAQIDLDEKTRKEKEDKLKTLLEADTAKDTDYESAKTDAEVNAIHDREQKKLEAQEIADLEKAKALGASEEQLSEIKAFYVEKDLENDKAAADEKLKVEQAVADQKKALDESRINLVEKGVAFLGAMAGKNKALQKAAIIAENAVAIGKTLIANAAGNAQAAAVAAPLIANPITAAAATASLAAATLNNNISTGIGVAMSIAATAKALSALGGGGDGGGGAGTQAAPMGGNVPKVDFQSSSENQIGNSVANKITATPVQAFVVASSITTAQSIERNKITENSI